MECRWELTTTTRFPEYQPTFARSSADEADFVFVAACRHIWVVNGVSSFVGDRQSTPLLFLFRTVREITVQFVASHHGGA